jgi:hypothetical protein
VDEKIKEEAMLKLVANDGPLTSEGQYHAVTGDIPHRNRSKASALVSVHRQFIKQRIYGSGPPASRCDMRTETVLPESELRLRAQERMADGRLPVRMVTLIEASYGRGNVCCVCDRPITPDKVEYDVVDPRDTKYLSLHFSCHVIWQRECAQHIAAVERADNAR